MTIDKHDVTVLCGEAAHHAAMVLLAMEKVIDGAKADVHPQAVRAWTAALELRGKIDELREEAASSR